MGLLLLLLLLLFKGQDIVKKNHIQAYFIWV